MKRDKIIKKIFDMQFNTEKNKPYAEGVFYSKDHKEKYETAKKQTLHPYKNQLRKFRKSVEKLTKLQLINAYNSIVIKNKDIKIQKQIAHAEDMSNG